MWCLSGTISFAMNLFLEPKKQTHDYLADTEMIDSTHSEIKTKAEALTRSCRDVESKAKVLFEFVRDTISHSFDIQNSEVTCIASEVFKKGHGICFAKSHLLAAMNRAIGIPTGFCYQKLVFDEKEPCFTLHGLNAI